MSANPSATGLSSPIDVRAPGDVDPLLSDPRRFAFFQAMRLIRLRHLHDGRLSDHVRVRPAATLSFPENDIEAMTLDPEGRYAITANFFGLYGVTSPLPTFYTEDLIDETLQGKSSTRDFIDVLHAALYPLLFEAWKKNRLWLTIGEHRDTARLDQLLALVGLSEAVGADAKRRSGSDVDSDKVARDDHMALARALLPHAGNFNQFPRSAVGLQALAAGLVDGIDVDVEPCVVEEVSIPADGRLLLGERANALGESAVLGSWVAQCCASLIIHIGPIPASRFHDLLPGAPGYERLAHAIRLYLRTPIRCTLGLSVVGRERESARLGAGWQQLGRDTWIATGVDDSSAQAPFDEIFLPLNATVSDRQGMPSCL